MFVLRKIRIVQDKICKYVFTKWDLLKSILIGFSIKETIYRRKWHDKQTRCGKR